MIGEQYKVCFLQETHLSQWKCGLTGGGEGLYGGRMATRYWGGGGGVETGHLTWHHLISWDNMHMVDWSDCRPLLSYSVKQEILDTCQLPMTILHCAPAGLRAIGDEISNYPRTMEI